MVKSLTVTLAGEAPLKLKWSLQRNGEEGFDRQGHHCMIFPAHLCYAKEEVLIFIRVCS